MIAEQPQKPVGEALDQILAQARFTSDSGETTAPKKPGFFTNLQRFLNALSR